LLKVEYIVLLGLVSDSINKHQIPWCNLTAIDDATLSDRKRLKEEYGIKTIMDLRTVYFPPLIQSGHGSNLSRTEHANQAKKRDADLKLPSIVHANAALSEPLQIPGMNYLRVNVNGKGFERSLLWQLSTWNITWVQFDLIRSYC
jgi:protein-tyrosine phosphatase